MYLVAGIIVLLSAVSLATGMMKLLDGPWYAWFDHARTPLNTSLFFFGFSGALMFVAVRLALYRCPCCSRHWLRADDVGHEDKSDHPRDKHEGVARVRTNGSGDLRNNRNKEKDHED